MAQPRPSPGPPCWTASPSPAARPTPALLPMAAASPAMGWAAGSVQPQPEQPHLLRQFRPYGGATLQRWPSSGASSPSLTNVTFFGNTAGVNGGALYNNGSSGASSPSLTNVTFFSNTAGSTAAHSQRWRHRRQSAAPASPTSSCGAITAAGSGSQIYNYCCHPDPQHEPNPRRRHTAAASPTTTAA